MSDPIFHICPIEPLIRITGFCSAHENVKPIGYSYDGESHDFWEALFVASGRAEVTAGETVFSLSGGQMIFTPPDEFHRIRNGGDCDMHFFVLSFSADRFGLDSHRVFPFTQIDEVSNVVHQLRELFVVSDRKFLKEPKTPTDWGAIQQTVNRLELLLLTILSQEGHCEPQRDKNAELYSTAVLYMQQHLADNLTAPQIAEYCKVSLSSAQKLFARYTGMGLVCYYTQLRMRRAKELLLAGHTVKETAVLLGFGDQNYFSTVYRRYYGFPPSKQRPAPGTVGDKTV